MRQLLTSIIVAMALAASPAHAAEQPTAIALAPTVEFPNQITFYADVAAAAGIRAVSLEYGVTMLTCGDVVARAFPDIEPGTTAAEVAWTWDMRQSGSLPPGSRIWFRWLVTDAAGATTASERGELIWLDDMNPWRQITRGDVTLHWFRGSDAYAEDLLATADAALRRLTRDIGVTPRDQVQLYIYPDNDALREAVLYEPHWTGGLAYPAHSIVIIGIAPDDLEWGRRTVAHELSHVLVGHRSFSCLGHVPSWLDEGLAMYGEGDMDAQQRDAIARAVEQDRLLPLSGLGAGFSEQRELADLSYAQSHSVVRFLLDTYGRERLLALLDALSGGATIDAALGHAYGLDLIALEDQWHASLGAEPLRDARQAPTALAPPTPVPTFVPAGAPAPAVAGDAAQPSAAPAIAWQALVAALVLLIALAAVALGVRRAARRRP